MVLGSVVFCGHIQRLTGALRGCSTLPRSCSAGSRDFRVPLTAERPITIMKTEYEFGGTVVHDNVGSDMLLTRSQAARLLQRHGIQIEGHWLSQMARYGRVPYVQTGAGRLFRAADLEQYAAERRAREAAGAAG